jgi:ribosome biogenesis GTPase A
MKIQWYPGHMYKANKDIKAALPKVDLVIEVLDARIPFSSQNPVLSSLRGNKPCIKLLNKSDLADPEITRIWQDYFEKENNVKTLAVTSEHPEKLKQLPELCNKLIPGKNTDTKTLHAMIMGIPNVGKSTIINILAGRTIAKTGNEPAITRAQQRIKLASGIALSDTPGVLWPNIHNKNTGYRLATTGAIKDTAMDYTDVAFFAVNYIKDNYANNLKARYSLDELPETELEILELIGKKRGCLRSGGQVELNKVSTLLLNELRTGTLGKISLETPEMMISEINQLEKELAQKNNKRSARKKRKK